MSRHIDEIQSESIYVLLTETGTLFSKLIKRFTAAPYNHASLALDAELTRLFSFGRKQATNPWSAGFVHEDPVEGTFGQYPETRCVVLRLRISERQRHHAIRIIDAFQQKNWLYRYNLVGLFGVLMKTGIEPKNAYFCSQFVAETLRTIGLSLWNRPSSLVTPHDFLLHPAFEMVYEGRLADYPGTLRQVHENRGYNLMVKA